MFRTYGHLENEESGFYSCDNTGIINPEDTEIRSETADNGIRGKYEDGDWVDDSAIVTDIMYQEDPRTGITLFDTDESIPNNPTEEQLKDPAIAGTDKNYTNDVLRVGDDIVYQVMVTSAMNEGEHGTDQASIYASLVGGELYFTCTVPEYDNARVEWDINNMSWIKNPKTSNNGRTISGYMAMTTDKISVPGSQTMQFALKLAEGGNAFKTMVKPEFKAYWKGNISDKSIYLSSGKVEDTYEAKTFTEEQEIMASSISSYNISLFKNLSGTVSTQDASLFEGSSINLLKNSNKVVGKNYYFASSVIIESDDAEKLLKGYELPKGSIKYDINMEITDSEGNNVTEDLMPQVVVINTNTLTASKTDNEKASTFYGPYFWQQTLPYGYANMTPEAFAAYATRDRYVYNS